MEPVDSKFKKLAEEFIENQIHITLIMAKIAAADARAKERERKTKKALWITAGTVALLILLLLVFSKSTFHNLLE